MFFLLQENLGYVAECLSIRILLLFELRFIAVSSQFVNQQTQLLRETDTRILVLFWYYVGIIIHLLMWALNFIF